MESGLIVAASNALAPQMSERAREYARASKSPNTQKAYGTAWAEFEAFCQTHGQVALPALPETIVDYLTHLADASQRVSTIQVKLAAIVFAHRALDGKNPGRSEPVRILMQGIRRKLGRPPQQKAPLLRDDLAHLVNMLPDSLAGKRDKAILLLGFAGAFRRSELVTLNVEDVRFSSREMVITLQRSKTDQEGAGSKKRIPKLQDPTLCPVRALQDWLNLGDIHSGALFRPVDRWGHARSNRLTSRIVAIIIKQSAERAGLDPRQFAGHSLRAGFVTQAANDQTPEWAIAEVTGHRSRAVLQRYIRDAGVGQVRAIRKAFGESD